MLIRVFLAFLFSLCGLALSAEAASIAKVAGFSGNPTANGRPLTIGSELQEHDNVIVGTGNVQVIFTDGTRMVVGENSTLVIEKYLMKSGNKVSSFSIDALRGTFRFITGGSAKSAYNIKTANATIGIRGTAFDFWVDRATGVVLVNGKVLLCRGGKCVSINPGGGGIADPGNVHQLGPLDYARSNQRLPFLLNQGKLKPPFRLYTTFWYRKFSNTNDFNNGGGHEGGNTGNGGGTTPGRPTRGQ